MKYLVIGIVAFVFLYRQVILPSILTATTTSWAANIAEWIDSILVGVLFLLGEWLIRTKLWKFEKAALNFSGLWSATSRYMVVEKDSDTVTAETHKPFGSSHTVLIEQDCLGIAIQPTAGPFASWYSVAMNILDGNKIGYAYHVNYSDLSRFPQNAKGYEELSVVERRKTWLGLGRPIKLSGYFYHCAQGHVPVYRGTVSFELMDDQKRPRGK